MKKKLVSILAGLTAAATLLSGCGKKTAEQPNLDELIQAASQEMSIELPGRETSEASAEEDSSAAASSEAPAEDSSEEASLEETTEEAPAADIVSNKRKPEPVKLMEGDALSDDEIKQFQEFFSTREGYGLASHSFSSPEKINWNIVYCFGSSTGNCQYSQDALKVFLDARGLESVGEGVYAISGNDVRTFVEAKTGIAGFDVSSMTGFVYVESEDVLFDTYSDPFIYDGDIIVAEGVRSEGKIQLLVKSTIVGSNNRIITVTETGNPDNPYHYYSNRELWENSAAEVIDAKDYDTNETITCSIKYFNNGPRVGIIQDGNVVNETGMKHKIDDKADDEIKDMAFGDFDGDGIKDVVMIWYYEGKTVAVLHSGTGREPFDFSKEKDAVTDWLSENVKNLTVNNVVEYLLAHQDELNEFTW